MTTPVVAVDCNGADLGPAEVAAGARLAAAQGASVLLFGPAAQLQTGRLPEGVEVVDAPISIRESRPNPARATERAATAAMASTTIPGTFQINVTYSRAKPRRSRTLRATPSAEVTEQVWQAHSGHTWWA